MAFMQRQVSELQFWYELDGPMGVEFIPQSLVGTFDCESLETPCDTPEPFKLYTENSKVWSIELRQGYGARLSAPGYMDRTEWCVFDSVAEAETYLEETYGEDD